MKMCGLPDGMANDPEDRPLPPEEEDRWYDNHQNLAFLARHLADHEGADVDTVIYMLQKPWKYAEEYAAAEKLWEETKAAEAKAVFEARERHLREAREREAKGA